MPPSVEPTPGHLCHNSFSSRDSAQRDFRLSCFSFSLLSPLAHADQFIKLSPSLLCTGHREMRLLSLVLTLDGLTVRGRKSGGGSQTHQKPQGSPCHVCEHHRAHTLPRQTLSPRQPLSSLFSSVRKPFPQYHVVK